MLTIPESHTSISGPDGKDYACELCGHPHTRITTMLDAVVPKPGLVPWAFKCGKLGLDIEEEKNRGGDRGTELHEYLADYIETGDLRGVHSLSEEVQPYGQQLSKFILDYEPEFLGSEILVVSHDLDVAGRLDGFVKIHKQPPRRNKGWALAGSTVLFDLKTNKQGSVYTPAHLLQLAGYAHMWKTMGGEHHDHEAVLAVGPESYQFAVNYFGEQVFISLARYYGQLMAAKANNPNGRPRR